MIILTPKETKGVARGGRKRGEQGGDVKKGRVGTIAPGKTRRTVSGFGAVAVTMAWMTAASGIGAECLIAVSGLKAGETRTPNTLMGGTQQRRRQNRERALMACKWTEEMR